MLHFRCGIPVVIMGETGCGKTRLIRYMCGLQSGPGGPRNMLLMKVHYFRTDTDVVLAANFLTAIFDCITMHVSL